VVEDLDDLVEGFHAFELVGCERDVEVLFDDHPDFDEVEGVEVERLECVVVEGVWHYCAPDFFDCCHNYGSYGLGSHF
jgi:hypothetical protein